jgi:hypothetical protein
MPSLILTAANDSKRKTSKKLSSSVPGDESAKFSLQQESYGCNVKPGQIIHPILYKLTNHHPWINRISILL